LIIVSHWKKLWLCAAPACRWGGRRSHLYFQTLPDSYNAESLIAFLRELRRHFRGEQDTMIWDGFPAHMSRLTQASLQSQLYWLRVVRLPGYASDLNPEETLWSNLKGQEPPNRCSTGLGEADSIVRQGKTRAGRS